MKRSLSLLAVVLLAFPMTSRAEPVYREIPFVKNVALGVPGTYTFRFSLWDAADPASPTGTMLWSESKKIRLTSPTLKHVLGSVDKTGNPLEPAYFTRQLWVQVERWNPITSTGVILGRRTKLTIVPYALASEAVPSGSLTSEEILDGSVTAADLADGTALAEILDDDGAGSGLDADLIDGRHAADLDAAYVDAGEPNSITVGMVADGAVTKPKLSAAGGTTGQVLSTNGTNLQWISPQNGDVTGVTAGSGLTGGGTAADVTLDVGQGTGILVSADTVSVDTSAIQRRVTASCADGAVRAIGSDGSVTCARETNVWHVEGAQYLYLASNTIVRELTVPGRLGTYVVTASGTLENNSDAHTRCSLTTGTAVEDGYRFDAWNSLYTEFPFSTTRAFTYACTSPPCYLPTELTFRLICTRPGGTAGNGRAVNASMVVMWFE
ncbi:MAG TPA: hypothetical protein VN317_00465 [Candidatus Methanoperedens sp.]|nr:hypothetical protein [Candidatus Methanoperedens sp.]